MEKQNFDPELATQAYIDALGPEALEKAAAYTMGNHWLILAGLLVSALVTYMVVRWGGLARIESKFGKRPIWASFVVSFVYLIVSTLISLPWSIYQEWWRETKYGRTSQPITDYLGQGAIELAISSVVLALFFMLVYLLIRKTGRLWWLLAGGLTSVFLMIAMLLGPTYIEPLFNKYEAVPSGEVRNGLLPLAKQAGIPEDRLLMYDGSRQSNNFTANVSGIGDSARIAISDVAMKDASLNEVLAVTGHEIGHFTLGHVWRMIATMSILAALAFFLLHKTFPWFASVFKTNNDIAAPSTLPVFIFAFGVFLSLAQPVMNAVVRMGEKEADQYSMETVNLPDALASALVKTAEYRDPRPAAWQELLFYTHPSVESRVRSAMEWKAKN